MLVNPLIDYKKRFVDEKKALHVCRELALLARFADSSPVAAASSGSPASAKDAAIQDKKNP